MGNQDGPHRIARFEGFELDLRAGELRHNGDKPVSLAEQPFRILVMLLERPGDLVTREQIREGLWPNGTIVEFEHSISAAINRLRQLLGDSAEQPRYIETLARRGYRCKVRVEWMERPREPGAVPAKSETATPIPFDQSLVGKKVSHYRVLGILGGGGMGVVYKAEDLKLGRQVALKFLPDELASDPAALARFGREARAASVLNHPNICTIHEIEEHDGKPFIVMELLEGETLREVISRSMPGRFPLELRKLLELGVQISEGVDAAHRLGIVHRDIKPANIFLTTQGRAKILDFGLAKVVKYGLSEDEELLEHSADSGPHEKAHTPAVLKNTQPDLSRTGVDIGTAGYMSPEQARGEKVDSRTDLFSFGLVLYELATGQRAFPCDAESTPDDLLPNQLPSSAMKLNPTLPVELGKIIDRALESDREARYQSAAEIRSDLMRLLRGNQPRIWSSNWAIAGSLCAGLLILSATYWYGGFGRNSQRSSPEPKLRQLTTNSFENRVTSGGISPDGKYLAYGDTTGLYVRLIERGETRPVLPPEEFNNQSVAWQWVAWFPDSTGFVTNAHRSGPDPTHWDSAESSIWIASVLGGAPRKIRENAIAWSVSPNGSLISFGTNKGKFGEHEIWQMGPNGDQVRKLFDSNEDSSIFGLAWSPDGKQVLYGTTDQSGDTLLSRDLNDGPAITIFGTNEMRQLNDLLWLADGQLLFSREEPESSFGGTCNFWEMQLDRRKGNAAREPKRLTNWSGFCMSGMSETADGKRLAFLKWAGKQTAYLADLTEGGTRILHPRHFPLSDSSDGAVDWTPDSQAIVLVSNRSGHHGIYKQYLNKEVAEPILTEGFGRNPRVTPDGKSIVYLGKTLDGAPVGRAPEPVMRISIEGGASQELFIAKRWSLLSCPRTPLSPCVIGEPSEDGKQLIVSAIDLLKGRGPILLRFDLVANDDSWSMDLSPDGTRVALTQTQSGPIYILSLKGQTLQKVQVKGWNNLLSLIWAADGKSLFVTAGIRNGREILNVDLRGNAHALWEDTGGSFETLAHPSPDGRYLTLDNWVTNGNMWMLENF